MNNNKLGLSWAKLRLRLANPGNWALSYSMFFLSGFYHVRLYSCEVSSCKVFFPWVLSSFEVVLLQGWLYVRSSSHEVVFLWGRLPVRSSSFQVVFLWNPPPWCYLPMRSSSCEVAFLLGCLPVRSTYCEVVFLWGCSPERLDSI